MNVKLSLFSDIKNDIEILDDKGLSLILNGFKTKSIA